MLLAEVPGTIVRNESTMQMVNNWAADADRLRNLTTGVQVLDFLEDRFRSSGATRFLATGLPMPGRPLEPLVLRANWGEYRAERQNALTISQNDMVLQTALRAKRPFEWPSECNGMGRESQLVSLSGPPGEVKLIGIPVTAFQPYQGVVLGAGEDFSLDPISLCAIEHLCGDAFAKLFELEYIRRERPGDLSARERRVVELSAVGNTANDIAELLKISQRTVHAHLQNASEKLRASNKTHTVVEALLYGQVDI